MVNLEDFSKHTGKVASTVDTIRLIISNEYAHATPNKVYNRL